MIEWQPLFEAGRVVTVRTGGRIHTRAELSFMNVRVTIEAEFLGGVGEFKLLVRAGTMAVGTLKRSMRAS